MHVSRDTSDQLIVEHKPLGMALVGLVFALVFVFVGLSNMSAEPLTGVLAVIAGIALFFGILALYVDRTLLVLDRTTGTATLSRLTPRGRLRWQFDLADIHRAEHDVRKSRKGGDLYRAALVVDGGMDAGRHDLSRLGLDDDSPVDVAKTINRWLAEAKGTRAGT